MIRTGAASSLNPRLSLEREIVPEAAAFPSCCPLRYHPLRRTPRYLHLINRRMGGIVVYSSFQSSFCARGKRAVWFYHSIRLESRIPVRYNRINDADKMEDLWLPDWRATARFQTKALRSSFYRWAIHCKLRRCCKVLGPDYNECATCRHNNLRQAQAPARRRA